MRVTGITELSSSRCRIELDDEFAFVLYKGELHQYGIAEGSELGEEDYRQIMEEVLPKRAKLRCMHLLQGKDYTEGQLREKLRQGMFPADIIDEAVTYVASFHYIDDLRYALDYIRSYEEDRSRIRMEQDLYRKGISGKVIGMAFSQWEEEGGTQNEQRMILDLLRKRNYRPETADDREKQKEYAFLMRKGFSAEEIRKALEIQE